MKSICFRSVLTAIICAFFATANAENRLWNPSDEENTNLADGANWNPAFDLTGETPDDISNDVLAINSTTNATLANDFSTKTLYVGKGSILNNGNFEQNANYDRGAKLDVSAGTLTLTDTLWVGGGYADYRDCILNLSGSGRIVVNYLQTGDCASRTDDASHTNIRYDDGNGDNMKANYINIGVGTEIDVKASANLSTYSGGTTFVNVNGTLNTTNDFNVANSGKAYVQIDGGELNVGNNIRIGERNIGSVLITNGLLKTRWMEVGCNAKGFGCLEVANGGEVDVSENIIVGYSVGSTGVVNLVGGKISLKNGDSYKNFYVGREGKVTFNQTAGELEASDIRIGAYSDNTEAEWNFSGGTVTGNNNEVNVGAYRNTAKGTLNVTAGTLDLSGRTVSIGRERGKGFFNLTGGSYIGSALGIGAKSASAETADTYGEMNISGDSTATLSDFNIGCNWNWDFGATGVVNQVGGTVTATNMRFCQGKAPSKAVYNLTGGELNVTSYIAIGHRSDADSVGNYSEFNLKGGILAAPYISSQSNADYDTQVTRRFVFDGGTLKTTADSGNFVASNISCIRSSGGAKFDTDGHTVTIGNDFVVEDVAGEIVKNGSGALNLNGAVTVGRGLRVDNGSLAFAAGKLTDNTALTPAQEVVVASGASLDLGGATVYTQSYSVNGESFSEGTYVAHNGTIILVDSTAVAAVWTNILGDGDFTNPENWICSNVDGAVIYGVLPESNAMLTVPYDGHTLVEFRAVKAAFPDAVCVLGVAGSQKLDIAPDVVANAIAWYDFADADSVVTNDVGEALSVVNRGTAGAALDGIAYTDSGHDTCARSFYGESTLGGRNLLSLKKTYGFVTQNGAGIEGNADRSLLVLYRDKRNVYPNSYVQDELGNDTEEVKDWYSEIFPLGIEKVDGHWGGDGQFRIEDQAWRYVMSYQGGALEPSYAWLQEPDWRFTTMTSHDDGESVKVNGNAWRPEVNEFAAAGEQTAENLATPADYRIFVGVRRQYESASAGEIAEAMVFDKALSDAEYTSVTNYIAAKWFGGSVAGMNLPGNVALAEGSIFDLDGYSVALNSVRGSGAIANGTVTAIGTLNIVVNSDGTANKVVFPAGTSLTGGLTVSVTGLKNLTSASGHLVIAEAQTGDLAIEGNIVVVSADDADVKYYRVKLEDGKLVLYRNAGFTVIFR